MDRDSNFIMALVPILSTLSYMFRDPNMTIAQSIPYLLPMLIPIAITMSKHWRAVLQKLSKLFMFNKNSDINFTARINLKSWANEPDSVVRSFATVLWDWNHKNLTINCKKLMEEAVQRTYYYEEKQNNEQPIFIDDRDSSFWNKDEPNIKYTMWVERNMDREGNETKEIFLRIDFIGCVSPNTVVKHIDYIKEEAKRIKAERDTKQRVLVSSNECDDEEKKKGLNFMIYEFVTTSNFANFFCEEAQTVKQDLNHFLHSKNEYERLGRPWTYTILNEGPPGVGKTKLVKAIAKETGYTLIVLNLSHVQNTQVLYETFHTSVLGGETVPHNKRLYYIPEVDSQFNDMLKQRSDAIVEPTGDKNATTETTATTITNPFQKKSTKLTLGEILNILDGVPERHGHILILDTNRLKDLDKALIRPGRVDRIIKWKKMSKQSVKQYLEHYYKTKLPIKTKLPDRLYSAAELQAKVTTCPTLTEFIKS